MIKKQDRTIIALQIEKVLNNSEIAELQKDLIKHCDQSLNLIGKIQDTKDWAGTSLLFKGV